MYTEINSNRYSKISTSEGLTKPPKMLLCITEDAMTKIIIFNIDGTIADIVLLEPSVKAMKQEVSTTISV